MKFLVALALFAMIAVAAAVVAPVLPAALPAAGVVPVGYAGGPAAVVAPGVLREYHGAPLIHGFYSGLVA